MTKHLRFLFVMLLAMIWSAGWAAETVYKTLSFPDDNQAKNKVSSYASSWTAKIGSDSWSIVNFNNNNWGGWNNIRCGRKKYASVATITNSNAFDKPITKVVVNASDISNLAKVKSIKLETSKVANFSSIEETVKLATITAGYLTFEIKNPIENGFYKLTFDCLASANGFVQVDQVDYYIDDSKTSTNVSFGSNSNKTFTFTEGKLEGFSAPTATETNNVEGTIKYSSNNESAVKVDASTGALSFPGYGEATITATFTPTDADTYAESKDSYKVVNKADLGDFVFYESFDKCNGKGGNGGTFNGTASNSVVSENKGWIFSNESGANKCIKLGTKNTGGSATTPAINLSGKGILTFKIASWEGDGSKVTISVDNGSLSYNGKNATSFDVSPTDNEWNDINMTITATGAVKIKFSSSGAKNRFFLDEVMVKEITTPAVETLTLKESDTNTLEAKTGVNVTLKRTMVANEWNTICLPFDVTYDKAKAAFGNDVKIVELDTEAAVDANVLSFKPSTGIVAATPYLIKPSAVADEYTFENVDITNNEAGYSMTDNADVAFKGIYNMVDITKDVVDAKLGDYYAAFLGAGNKIYKAGTGMTKGFRAYFAIPKSASASALRVVIDGTATSIKNIDSEVVESNAPVYNLQGQRVDGNNLTPGIYVKAGKKFVVK